MKPIKPEQQKTAEQTLGGAFFNDPLLKVVAPDDDKRRAIGPWFMGKALAYGMRYGEVVCNDDASALAVWLPPGATELTPPRMLRVGMGLLPFKLGLRGAGRFMKALSITDKYHKEVKGPHWYLVALATAPERQGQGLGSQLVEFGTAKADAAGVPRYLETATESNVAFYTKRGFEVTGQGEFHGFKFYAMVRQPR